MPRNERRFIFILHAGRPRYHPCARYYGGIEATDSSGTGTIRGGAMRLVLTGARLIDGVREGVAADHRARAEA